MTAFSAIDEILLPWARSHELHVYVRDWAPPLRSLIVYYWRDTHHESAGHMWIDRESDGRVTIHGAAPDWHQDKTVAISEFGAALEEMFQTMIARPVWD